MYCVKCGAVYETGTKYCSKCGAEIRQITAAKKHGLGFGWKIGIVVAAALLALGGAFVAMGGADTVRMYRQLSLGNRYLDEMEYEQAIAAFEEAIEIAPKNPDPYIALAEVYMEMGDYDKAIDVLMEGLDQTGSSKIEDYIAEIMEDLRGFTGIVYAADTDFKMIITYRFRVCMLRSRARKMNRQIRIGGVNIQ